MKTAEGTQEAPHGEKLCVTGVSLQGKKRQCNRRRTGDIEAKSFLSLMKAQAADPSSVDPKQNKYKENYTYQCQ